jgi:hypothetical protein
VRHPPSHSAAGANASPLLAKLFTRNPESRSKTLHLFIYVKIDVQFDTYGAPILGYSALQFIKKELSFKNGISRN